MRAYKCDACGKLYLLPYDEKEGTYAEIPAHLVINENPIDYRTLDLCVSCRDKILLTIGRIQDPMDLGVN